MVGSFAVRVPGVIALVTSVSFSKVFIFTFVAIPVPCEVVIDLPVGEVVDSIVLSVDLYEPFEIFQIQRCCL